MKALDVFIEAYMSQSLVVRTLDGCDPSERKALEHVMRASFRAGFVAAETGMLLLASGSVVRLTEDGLQTCNG